MDACIIAGFSIIVILAAISLIGAWLSDDSKGLKISCTITIIIAIGAFLCAYVRNPFCFNGDEGMIGTIATIVSTPVAVLIGWNIYTLIDFESKINKTVNKILDEKSKSVYEGIIGANIGQDLEDAKFYTVQRDYPKLAFLYNRILRSYMKLNKDEQVKTMIDTINVLIDNHRKRIPPYFIDIIFETLEKLSIEYQNQEINNSATKIIFKIRELKNDYNK